jgi:hypothetical protein
MSTFYTNAARAAIEEPRVNVKKLARGGASKAERARIAAGISDGLIVPSNFSARQAAALVGVSPSYVSLHRKRQNNGCDPNLHHHAAPSVMPPQPAGALTFRERWERFHPQYAPAVALVVTNPADHKATIT